MVTAGLAWRSASYCDRYWPWCHSKQASRLRMRMWYAHVHVTTGSNHHHHGSLHRGDFHTLSPRGNWLGRSCKSPNRGQTPVEPPGPQDPRTPGPSHKAGLLARHYHLFSTTFHRRHCHISSKPSPVLCHLHADRRWGDDTIPRLSEETIVARLPVLYPPLLTGRGYHHTSKYAQAVS